MNVISNINTKTLTKGASYLVIKVIEKDNDGLEYFTKKYRIVGDDGATRNYTVNHFERADDMKELLNGKFEVKSSSDQRDIGTIYNFINGVVKGFRGYLNLSGCTEETLFSGFMTVVEPYKEYLTINKLVEGKKYNCNYNKLVYRFEDGDLIDDDTNYVTNYPYSEYVEMKFTEHNPNQKRIDELKAEIASLKATHEISKNLIEREKEMISVREIELELLL